MKLLTNTLIIGGLITMCSQSVYGGSREEIFKGFCPASYLAKANQMCDTIGLEPSTIGLCAVLDRGKLNDHPDFWCFRETLDLYNSDAITTNNIYYPQQTCQAQCYVGGVVTQPCTNYPHLNYETCQDPTSSCYYTGTGWGCQNMKLDRVYWGQPWEVVTTGSSRFIENCEINCKPLVTQ